MPPVSVFFRTSFSTTIVPADPIPDPWMTFGFPTELQPTLPTFQYHLTQFPVPQTAQTLQPQISGCGIQEMQPEELALIPPINLPYHAQSPLPLPAILPTEVQPVISSTTAEASTAAAPFHQPSALSGLFDALLTTASATSPQVKHSDTSQHRKHTLYSFMFLLTMLRAKLGNTAYTIRLFVFLYNRGIVC